MMKHERNVEGLRQNAQKKRQEAIERTEQGIKQLLKEGKAVNFKTVAEVAGVSTAWLYKEPQIKERIEHLRAQQIQKKAPPLKQKATDASKDAMIAALKKRIKELEDKNRELSKQNEVAYGVALQVETLKQQVEGLRNENSKLREHLNDCIASREAEERAKPNSKVKPLTDKRTAHPSTSDKLQSELSALGIRVNSTLSKLLSVAPEEVVLKAIAALKEALTTTEVRNPCGFLVEAIRNTWIPNEGYEQKVQMDLFNKWYPLAQSLNLVKAATQIDGIQHVLTAEDEWIPFSQMLAEYPLGRLQQMA